MAGKVLITLTVLAAVIFVQSVPQQQYQQQPALPSTNVDGSTPVPIIAQSEENNADGSFNFR